MQRTTGTIISVKKQWWLKINKKPIRKGALDGAAFPYVIKVKYVVDGKEYIKRKWIGTEYPVPVEGAVIQLAYEDRAIVCSQFVRLCEQAPSRPIAPSGTARRYAQILVGQNRCAMAGQGCGAVLLY